LRGDQISRSAAIVAVADAYEVMTAVRSYKTAMSAGKAREELIRSAGRQFSPEVVRAFLCVSLGRLRLVAGPTSALAQIPFLGNAVRFPGDAVAAAQTATSAAVSAAPGVAASVVAASAVVTSTPTITHSPRPTPRAVTESVAQAARTRAPRATSATRIDNRAAAAESEVAEPKADDPHVTDPDSTVDPGDRTLTTPGTSARNTSDPAVRTRDPGTESANTDDADNTETRSASTGANASGIGSANSDASEDAGDSLSGSAGAASQGTSSAITPTTLVPLRRATAADHPTK
jgi:hypothetical protein